MSGLPPSLTVGVPLAFDAALCRFNENPCQCWGVLVGVPKTSHYLRLGAADQAETALGSLVHKTSKGLSAEHDLSRTPRTSRDEGGRDKEGEALRTCEPTQPCLRKRKAQGSPVPSLQKKVVPCEVNTGPVPLSFPLLNLPL